MPTNWDDFPPWLRSDLARSFWADLVEELRERGQLARATRYQVAWFCELLAVYVRSAEAVDRPDGLVDEFYKEGGDTSLRLPSAEVKILHSSLTQLRKLTKELGLNDVSTLPPGGPRDRLRAALGQLSSAGHG